MLNTSLPSDEADESIHRVDPQSEEEDGGVFDVEQNETKEKAAATAAAVTAVTPEDPERDEWRRFGSSKSRRFTVISIVLALLLVAVAIILPWRLVWAKNEASNKSASSTEIDVATAATRPTAPTATSSRTNTTANAGNSTKPTRAPIEPLSTTPTSIPSQRPTDASVAPTDTPTLLPTLRVNETVTPTTLVPTVTPTATVLPTVELLVPTLSPVRNATTAPVTATAITFAPVEAAARTAFPTIPAPPSVVPPPSPMVIPTAPTLAAVTFSPTVTAYPTISLDSAGLTASPVVDAQIYTTVESVRSVLLTSLPPAVATALDTTTTVSYRAFTEMTTPTSLNWQYISSTPLTSAQLVQHYSVTVVRWALMQSTAASAASECTWPGVQCDSKDRVTHLAWPNQSTPAASRQLPMALGALTGLRHVDLADNALQGPIPTSLFALRHLQVLYLHNNTLTGTLSETGWARLSSLRHLYLGDNALTGPLPAGLGSPGLTSANVRPLSHLILYNNSLTGTIPINWNLRDLAYLDLGFNALTGTIPTDWVDTMISLRTLYLSHNQLSGSMPDNFATVGNSRLSLVSVQSNALTGEIPGGFARDTLDVSEWYNNDFFSLNEDLCRNIVFEGGEMAVLRADCDVCRCNFWCSPGECVE